MADPVAPRPNVTLATLAVVDDPNSRVTVHFNPASLQLTLSNELKGDNKNDQRKQYVAKTSAKLSMDLQFDTTDSGKDVTQDTRKLQAFIVPPKAVNKSAKKDPPAPIVLFEWGTLKFKGVAESYKETIDYFSAEGVPLRAQVSLTLTRQDQVFDPSGEPASKSGDAVDAPFNSSSDAANSAGSPNAARDIAAANGEENLRFGAAASLTIEGNVTLKPAAAFSAGGGAGFGIGGGAGLGIDGGAGLGISGGAGFSLGGGIGGGISVSTGLGLAGTARLSATEGAFSGLRANLAARSSVQLDPSRVLPRPASVTLATDAGASFRAGGKATFSGAAGLRADVGAATSGKITFDAS